MRVLDAGCGTGAISRRIAMKASSGEVFGVDIDPLFIEKAKKAAVDEGIRNVHFELGNVDELEYEDGFFDLAYCNVVLMHMKDPVKTITELRRVTKKGGFVAASDVDDDTMLMYPTAPKFYKLWSKFAKRAATKGMDRHIGRKLYSIFSKAGLYSTEIYPLPLIVTQRDKQALETLIQQWILVLEQDKNDLIKEGVATRNEYKEVAKEAKKFSDTPGSFLMVTFFLALGEHAV
jgi:ubiquinone/menaquinone biosynthesis C-methylase UbiE